MASKGQVDILLASKVLRGEDSRLVCFVVFLTALYLCFHWAGVTSYRAERWGGPKDDGGRWSCFQSKFTFDADCMCILLTLFGTHYNNRLPPFWCILGLGDPNHKNTKAPLPSPNIMYTYLVIIFSWSRYGQKKITNIQILCLFGFKGLFLLPLFSSNSSSHFFSHSLGPFFWLKSFHPNKQR